MDNIITSKDVLELFEGNMTYRILLGLIRAKKIPALKLGNKFVFSRQAIIDWRDKKLGVIK